MKSKCGAHDLPEDYFDTYDDMQQLAQEWELEEMDARILERCDTQCRARQVHVSDQAKAVSEITGREEWSYVDAKCTRCGRMSGRGACLVNIVRS